MSKLFAELYLDEDVDVLVADLVRARGFTIITTRDANNLGKSDHEQLTYAAQHNLAFFTHNRVDFENLGTTYFDTNTPHPGIIIAARHGPHEITRRLLILLNTTTADEMESQIIYI